MALSKFCHQQVLSPGSFITRKFCHQEVLSPGSFVTRKFCHQEVLSPGSLVTRRLRRCGNAPVAFLSRSADSRNSKVRKLHRVLTLATSAPSAGTRRVKFRNAA